MPHLRDSGHPEPRQGVRQASYALVAYAVIALVGTWPLVRGLGRDVAWDLGDSLLNMWILAWDSEQIIAILTGDLSRVRTFFDANIFYPAPLTLAYSEHLLPQAFQIFPVYLITKNPILCYNLLFLSTFALSGLGMYLFVRELTGNAKAAFVAGLAFAFAPYRVPQSGHLQVLSSQWMPFVFYALLRYFESRRIVSLAGAAGALAAQILSCGYYLFFFTPFVVAFALWEIGRRRRWRDWRMWGHLGIAGLAVGAVTIPFLLPYLELRRQGYNRTLAEVTRFSADVYSYATAHGAQRLWGGVLEPYWKAEGELFPGLVLLLLAVIGVAFGIRDPGSGIRTNPQSAAQDSGPRNPDPGSRTRIILAWVLAMAAAAYALAAVVTLAVRRVNVDLGPFALRITDITQVVLRGAVLFVLLLVVSQSARARVAAFMRDRGFFVVGIVAAFWLSLGPLPQSMGRPVDIVAPYRLLYDYVPGFDGIRVPARLAMIVTFMLAVLAGYGAAVLGRSRIGQRALIVLCAALLVEGTRVPLIINGMTPIRDFNAPEPRLYRPARAPAIYHAVAQQPADSILVELPLGEPDFDLRAMYYSSVHWRPILNGYSGFFPPHYGRLWTALTEMPRHPELSLQALRDAGATHVIVHEGAYLGDEGRATSSVLRDAGAVQLFRQGSDVLFRLPRLR